MSTFGARLVLLLDVRYAGVAVALSTATGVGQPPSHQGTLFAVEVIKDSVYKLTLVAERMVRLCHFRSTGPKWEGTSLYESSKVR